MKKLFSYIIIICTIFILSGCSGVYSNYREIEQLLVIQTMGIDAEEGGLGLSLASAAEKGRSSPVRLHATGASITTAMERALYYSRQKELFYSHIGQIVIGEEAARTGLEHILSYICRSPEIRIDVPLFVVRGGSAKEAVMDVGDSSTGISEVLQGVYQNVEERGDSTAFSAADIVRDLERHGSALICAIQCRPSAEKSSEEGGQSKQDSSASSSGQEGGSLTAVTVGYGVINQGELQDYIDSEDALGLGLLLSDPGINDLTVRDKYAAPVTLEIDRGHCDIRPIWQGDRLHGLDISIRVGASVVEISDDDKAAEADYEDYLVSRLEAEVSERVSRVLQLSKRLQADFLGLGSIVEQDSPEKYRALDESFAELLPKLTFQISISGQMNHTNDIRDGQA